MTAVASAGRQLAQLPQIYHILAEILSLRRFQHFRNFTKTAVTHDEAEGREADFALADMFVSVYARTAVSFGIV